MEERHGCHSLPWKQRHHSASTLCSSAAKYSSKSAQNTPKTAKIASGKLQTNIKDPKEKEKACKPARKRLLEAYAPFPGLSRHLELLP